MEVSSFSKDTFLLMTSILTLKEKESGEYLLNYPNSEIENSLASFFFRDLLPKDNDFAEKQGKKIKEAVASGEYEDFIDRLNKLFRRFPDFELQKLGEDGIRSLVRFVLAYQRIEVWQDAEDKERSLLEFRAGDWHWLLEIKTAWNERERILS